MFAPSTPQAEPTVRSPSSHSLRSYVSLQRLKMEPRANSRITTISTEDLLMYQRCDQTKWNVKHKRQRMHYAFCLLLQLQFFHFKHIYVQIIIIKYAFYCIL